MEIEITDKKNNPFLKRTEVKFIISHINQSTPNQAIIRNELAQSLNAKKEHIIIDHIESHFGIQKTRGYAKVYTSRKEAESLSGNIFSNETRLKRKNLQKKKNQKKKNQLQQKPPRKK